MNERRDTHLTNEAIERELTAMTEPTSQTEPTALWREALDQTRRRPAGFSAGRRMPSRGLSGRSRLVVAIAAVLAIGVGLGQLTLDWYEQGRSPTRMGATLSVIGDSVGTEAMTSTLDSLLGARSASPGVAYDESGPHQRATLNILRAMRESGSRLEAQAHSDRSAAFSDSVAGLAASSAPSPLLRSPVLRLLERQADVGLRSDNVTEAASRIRALVEPSVGEFVIASTVRLEDAEQRAAVSLRVRAERFDAVMDQVSAIGVVLSSDARATDLSLEIEAIDARLASALQSAREFARLADDSPRDARVMPPGQAQLAASRSTIDQLMEQRAALEERAAWATVRVLVVMQPEAVIEVLEQAPGFLGRLGSAMRDGLASAGDLTVWMLGAITSSLPVILLVAMVAWLGWRFWPRR